MSRVTPAREPGTLETVNKKLKLGVRARASRWFVKRPLPFSVREKEKLEPGQGLTSWTC